MGDGQHRISININMIDIFSIHRSRKDDSMMHLVIPY